MKSTAYYVAQAKLHAGDAMMPDRQLAEIFGCSQQMISLAKHGNMSDPLALKIADLIKAEAGEVLMVARLERERDEKVKKALQSYAAKIFASASKKVAASVLIAASTLGLSSVHNAGGEGDLRPA